MKTIISKYTSASAIFQLALSSDDSFLSTLIPLSLPPEDYINNSVTSRSDNIQGFGY